MQNSTLCLARFTGIFILASSACMPAVAAQCSAITLVAPFPAGSTTDVIARAMARDMGSRLSLPIVVENKPGAEGQIAAQDVVRAKPDGCRLLFATSGNLSIAPYLRKKPPYQARDFTPIADVGRYTYVLYTSTTLPARSYAEFVEQVKRQPGQYNYGTGSNTNLIAFAFISQKSGLDMTRIPFQGEPPALQEMVAGRVQAIVATTLGIPYVKSNQLKALAVLSPKRTPLLPDTPTLKELGLPSLDIVPWAGLVGPAGLPDETTERLHTAAAQALQDKDVASAARAAGFELSTSSRAEFEKMVTEQDEVYRKRIQELGLPQQ